MLGMLILDVISKALFHSYSLLFPPVLKQQWLCPAGLGFMRRERDRRLGRWQLAGPTFCLCPGAAHGLLPIDALETDENVLLHVWTTAHKRNNKEKERREQMAASYFITHCVYYWWYQQKQQTFKLMVPQFFSYKDKQVAPDFGLQLPFFVGQNLNKAFKPSSSQEHGNFYFL